MQEEEEYNIREMLTKMVDGKNDWTMFADGFDDGGWVHANRQAKDDTDQDQRQESRQPDFQDQKEKREDGPRRRKKRKEGHVAHSFPSR